MWWVKKRNRPQQMNKEIESYNDQQTPANKDIFDLRSKQFSMHGLKQIRNFPPMKADACSIPQAVNMQLFSTSAGSPTYPMLCMKKVVASAVVRHLNKLFFLSSAGTFQFAKPFFMQYFVA